METLHGIVKLRLEQYNELLKNGSIVYGDKTLVYDPYVLYFTDEDVTEQITEGLEKIAEFEEGIESTFLNTNHTESQEVNAEEKIIGNTLNLHKVAKTGLYSDLIGKLEFASDNEAIAGTLTDKVISPKTLKSALATVATGGIENIFSFRGTAATKDNLPQTLNKIGDVYYVKEGSTCYVWIEDEESIERWEEFGPAVDVSQFDIATVEEAGVVKSSNANLEVSVSESGTMSVNGLSDVVIERISGTKDSPINLLTDLEVGKLYYVNGYIYNGNNIFVETYSNWILTEKTSADRVIFYSAYYSSYTSAINGQHVYDIKTGAAGATHTVIGLTESGAVRKAMNFGALTGLNGGSMLISGEIHGRSIYAPLASGTAGQILQSNGDAKAPTWIDAPTGGGTTGINIRRI